MVHKINNLQFNQLNGKVKQIKTLVYDAVKRDGEYVPGKMQDGNYQHSLTTFAENGNCIEHFTFGFDGAYAHTMYENGRMTDTLTYDKNGKLLTTRICHYYKDDLLSEIIIEDLRNDKIYRTTYEYNQQHKPVHYISYIGDQIENHTVISYNEENNEVENVIYKKKDTFHGRYVKRMNAFGKTEDSKEYDQENQLREHLIYEYNDKGEMTGWSSNGEYEEYNPAEDTDEYEYDHHHNWIKKISYRDDTPDGFSLREITYYDEESSSKDLNIHDNIYNMASQNNPIPPARYAHDLDLNQWKWIAEGSSESDTFSVERFYTQTYGFIPSATTLLSYLVELWALRKYLIAEFGAVEIYFYSQLGSGYWDEQLQLSILLFPRNKYVLKMDHIQHISSHQYEYDEPIDEEIRKFGNYIQTGQISIYFPAQAFGNRDADFETELDEIISSFRVKKKAQKPEISMVATLGTSFALRAYPVNDDFVIKDLDLNYGHGFEKFHKDLMNRLQKDGKGLVLFHGEPGTGKTYYIRHLLRRMADIKKVVIYMPPNMVDHLVEPAFMSFITAQVAEYKASGRSCVLLIEDAEPLLVARDADTRIQGITNLLNMTDGLLNDMLKLQIICTFNVNIKQLDKALLRPGRLVARKEFKALPEFEANILGHQLGIKHVFTAPASLSEIYSYVKDKQTITHAD